MPIIRRGLLLALGCCVVWGGGEARAGVAAARPRAAESEARLKRDVTFLASDECEGRGPQTEGLRKAGEYIAAEFKKAGLKPAFGDSYFQPFHISRGRGRLTLEGPGGQKIELKEGV